MEEDRQVQRVPDSNKSNIEFPGSRSASPLHVKHQQILSRHLSIGIVETSLEGRYIDVSEEFCQMLGYQRQELLQRGFQDVTRADDYQKEIRLHDQLLTGKMPRETGDSSLARQAE